MARITQKALKILAERIAKKIKEEKANQQFVLPRKIQKLQEEKAFLNERIEIIKKQVSVIDKKITDLGYKQIYIDSKTQVVPKDYKNTFINYEKDIFEELVLTNEFTKKNIEEIEKEIIAKYLKK